MEVREENPFTPRIRNFKSSRKTRMPNNVKTYDQTGDPEDHVKVFQAAAQVERWVMPIWCHMFNSTLIGAARVWFDELRPESIDGYKDLKEAFLAYFMQQKKYVKDPVEIHNIKQKDGETIEDFMEHFKMETGRMRGAPECMRISGFMHGVNNPESDFRGHSRKGRGSNRFTPLTGTPKEILVVEASKFQPPPPMVTPVEKRSSNKFCDFHNDKGHSTDECMHLKKHIEELVRAGKLSHLIKKIKQGREPPKQKGKRQQPKISPQQSTCQQRNGGTTRHRSRNGRTYNPPHSQIVPATTSLTGFNGEITWPLGQLRLLLTIGDATHSTKAWMNFMVVKLLSPYNGIIGQRGLKAIQAVPSTVHGMLKFPTEGGRNNLQLFIDTCRMYIDKYIDCYPLSEIDWKVESLCGYPFKCFLDAYKGYHQIQLAEADEEKTAFHIGQGVYCYTKMPFGLKNADATYQRLMDKAFEGQVGRNIEVYVDDLVVKSHTKAEMVRDIEETFCTLRKAHPITVITDQPIKQVMSRPDVAGRLQKWSIMLGEHNITYRPRTSVKGQILADFLIEMPGDASQDADYVMREIHEGSCSMHAGLRSVVAKAIRLGYYWPTMHKDACDMIRKCSDCQAIAGHIAGPFLEGPGKVMFLIVAIDYFTEWIEAKEVATITGGQRFASVKHPHSNRLVERANRSLGEGIKARLGDGNKNWVEELPHVLWAHRTMIKSSHGDTPFSLTYRTEAVIPAEIEMPTYRTAAVDMVNNNKELRLNLDLLKERRERAAVREAKAKSKMMKYYNARVYGMAFKPGDFVYRSNDASHAIAGGKLGPKWEGPYEVTEALGNGAYKLQSTDGTVLPRAWNVTNLKRCYL
nr:reverse transcriptase domain-containing protein [Tanacetum cinerariifolium]